VSKRDEYRAELLRLVKGSPQPEVSVAEIGRRMGVDEAEARSLVDELIAEQRLFQDGDRLVVVEPAAFEAPPDEPIP
jgi:DNA-binding IclR family transcriptional regulator